MNKQIKLNPSSGFKLSPKNLSQETIDEQTKEYLASLTEEELQKLLNEVNELKINK